jgi:hypothetical protein
VNHKVAAIISGGGPAALAAKSATTKQCWQMDGQKGEQKAHVLRSKDFGTPFSQLQSPRTARLKQS